MCEHNTSVVIYSGKETSVEICEWGCDKILIHKIQPNGVTMLVREVDHPQLAALRDELAKRSRRVVEMENAALREKVKRLEHIEAIADEVNTWLKNSGLGDTAHQRSLEAALKAE